MKTTLESVIQMGQGQKKNKQQEKLQLKRKKNFISALTDDIQFLQPSLQILQKQFRKMKI